LRLHFSGTFVFFDLIANTKINYSLDHKYEALLQNNVNVVYLTKNKTILVKKIIFITILIFFKIYLIRLYNEPD